MGNRIDLTRRFDNYAVYLPAIQKPFSKATYTKGSTARAFPEGLDLRDLNFLNPASKLWHYGYGLYSVGQFAVNARQADIVTQRDKSVTVLGDSGGYQIGKGTLPGFDKLEKFRTGDAVAQAWMDAVHVRRWIVEWLEEHANYAMTIDMPLWAKLPANRAKPFHKCSVEQLVKLTLENLKFIKDNQRGRTKWLNVIQGTTAEDAVTWWEAVKKYRFGGWALAGNVGWRGGIGAVLRQVLLMRDDGAFERGQDWLHVLGVSQAKWAVMLTAVQRGLRAKSNNHIRVSYDSASPTLLSGVYQQVANYPNYTANADTWVVRAARCPQFAKYASSTHPFPFMSPLGDRMSLSHLNVRAEKYNPKHFDEISHHLLTNHNTWVYVRSFAEANDLAYMDRHDALQFVPSSLLDVKEFIEDVLQQERWERSLKKNAKLFAAVDKMKDKQEVEEDMR